MPQKQIFVDYWRAGQRAPHTWRGERERRGTVLVYWNTTMLLTFVWAGGLNSPSCACAFEILSGSRGLPIVKTYRHVHTHTTHRGRVPLCTKAVRLVPVA